MATSYIELVDQQSVVDPEPWMIAKGRFLDGLDEHEKTLFAEATIENLFYDASNIERQDRKQSKSRAALRSLQPLISAVEEYGKALDVYSNIAPLYLSPIWGSIRVILALASSQGKFFDRMAETFGRIGDILPRFQEYQRIFNSAKHYRFTLVLSTAYLDIIVLCTEFRTLLRAQQKSSMKRIFSSISPALNQRLEEAVQRFRQHRKEVDKEAEVCHMIEEKEARDLVVRNNAAAEARDREKKQRVMIANLSQVDYEYKHRRMQRTRHPGTGSWFFSLPEYKNWLGCSTSSFMCCYGIPGCGKSVLTSSLIDGLRSNSTDLLAFYYCDYADKRTLEAAQVFASISQQLLRRLPVIPVKAITCLETICRNQTTPDADQLLELLLAITSEIPLVTIVVDGLDEAVDQERNTVIHGLKSLSTTQSQNHIKIFIASREDISYLPMAECMASFKIRIGTGAINQDIDSYVQYAVQDLVKRGELVFRDPKLEQEICSALVKGAKGMFLWVRFQLEDLCAAETDNDLKSVLRDLPQSLGETYQRLLARIDLRRRTKYIKRIFNWIIFAKRPLTTAELQEAIAFDIYDESYDVAQIPSDLNRLCRACGNLIFIDEDTSVVQFSHYTVQQYLLDPANQSSGYQISPIQAEFEIGTLCVTYLSFSDFETQVVRHVDNVTPHVVILESAIKSQALLPAQGMGNVVKFITKLRGRHETSSSSNIEYGRFAQAIPTHASSAPLKEKYSLLPYIIDNWLSHTANFREAAMPSIVDPQVVIIAIRYFRNLLFGYKTFDIHPWVHSNPVKFFAYYHPLKFAVANNHIPILEALQAKDDFVWATYIGQTVRALFHTRIPNHTVEPLDSGVVFIDGAAMIPRVHEFHESDQGANPWLFMFYLLLKAARSGRIEVFQFLLEGANYPYTGAHCFLGYLILEAAEHDQQATLKVLCKMSLKGGQPLPWATTRYEGMACNALEIAALRGNFDLCRSIHQLGCRPTLGFADNILDARPGGKTLSWAFSSQDGRLIQCLLWALAPAGTYHDSRSGLRGAHKTFMLPIYVFVSLCNCWAEAGCDAPAIILPHHLSWATYLGKGDIERLFEIFLGSASIGSLQGYFRDGGIRRLLLESFITKQFNKVNLLWRAGVRLPRSVSVDEGGFSGREHDTSIPWFFNLKQLSSFSPLAWAILDENPNLMTPEEFKAYKPDLNKVDPTFGYAPTHLAIIMGDVELLKFLGSQGALLAVRDSINNRDLKQFTLECHVNQPFIRSQIIVFLEGCPGSSWNPLHKIQAQEKTSPTIGSHKTEVGKVWNTDKDLVDYYKQRRYH